jgi:hypothetical protein
MVTGAVAFTGRAPNEKAPVVAPGEMFISGGTVIAGSLADSATTTNPAAAGALRVTYPTPLCPPVTVFEARVNDDKDADDPFTVIGTLSLTSSYAATMFTIVVTGTLRTLKKKVALD